MGKKIHLDNDPEIVDFDSLTDRKKKLYKEGQDSGFFSMGILTFLIILFLWLFLLSSCTHYHYESQPMRLEIKRGKISSQPAGKRVPLNDTVLIANQIIRVRS